MFKAVTSMVKGIVGAIALLLVTTTAAMAQDKLAEGAKTVTTEMKTQLVLNDGQYSQVLDVNRAYLKKVKENNESGASSVAKAKKMQALNEEKDTKLKSVLTEVQYKKYAAGRAENTRKLKAFL
jgi:dTDP-glucose pyrophosphorylase